MVLKSNKRTLLQTKTKLIILCTLNHAEAREKAEELIDLGFGVADAAHIAFAEKTGASFISCDDRLVRKCLNHKIEVWCGNPVAFCEKEELK